MGDPRQDLAEYLRTHPGTRFEDLVQQDRTTAEWMLERGELITLPTGALVSSRGRPVMKKAVPVQKKTEGAPVERITVRVLEDIPEVMGPDKKTYRLRKEDMISLPKSLARALIKAGKAEVVDDCAVPLIDVPTPSLGPSAGIWGKASEGSPDLVPGPHCNSAELTPRQMQDRWLDQLEGMSVDTLA